ncbi:MULTISPECIES: small acid-soluble spore protein P [Paenibacillus]|uniref:Spore protein n=1 Tax=Paenibacillus odorifer TaxID=189426 RepID=A0A1R0Z8F3_9BACL|nr:MULTISPECIES: small acid-soluble spore protein P [Paenibacillus]AIQ21485.1 spore protein [Paenibacillus sp. FSL H7-0737]OMD45166.1 spore protein [Paenibacillus odorifer]OME64395.1 spore protein [Paenibacillus odorifer]
MSKPKSIPVPGAQPNDGQRRKEHNSSAPEPLSGSKKVKQANHVDHHNPQG